MLGQLWATIRGTDTDAALFPPCSYEDVHATTQAVLLPPLYPRGFSAHIVAPSAWKSFAVQGKCVRPRPALRRAARTASPCPPTHPTHPPFPRARPRAGCPSSPASP